MRKIGILIIYLWVTTFIIHAQNIRGTLIDELQQPVAYANVILQKADSSYLAGTTTNLEGGFDLPYQESAKFISISFIGYQTVCREIKGYDLGVIQMQPDAQVLGEVVVKGSRPVIKREIDRMVFNVESSPVAQGSNVMDLLKQTPLVKVTDSSIGIIGKNSVKVMLNGKISYLDSNDLVQYLNSLQSDDISSIEVITTPPSKYDADGNGGLIISAKIRQSRNKGEVDEEYHILQANSAQHSMTSRADTYKNIGGNLFFEYRLSSQSTLGAVYDFSYGKDKIDIDNNYQYSSYNRLDSTLYTQSLQEGKTIAHTVNLYYDLQLDTLGKKLGFAFNYMHHAPDKEVNFTTVNQETQSTSVVKEPNNINYSIFTGETNLELPFSWIHIETGTKYSDITNKSDMQYYNKIGTDFVEYPGRSNRFNYEEQTLAGYISARKSLNEHFAIQAGLRYEHTFVKGVTPNSDTEDVKTDYGKFFPTAL